MDYTISSFLPRAPSHDMPVEIRVHSVRRFEAYACMIQNSPSTEIDYPSKYSTCRAVSREATGVRTS